MSQMLQEANGTAAEAMANGAGVASDGPTGALGGEQQVSLKLVVSNPAAGSIIGRGGSTISEIQESSKAKLQVSRTGQYFPGTRERVLQLSGTLFQVVTALHMVLKKMQLDDLVTVPRHEDSSGGEDAEDMVELRLVCLNRLCGSIIGKDGDTIKSFMSDSSCKIQMQSKEDCAPGIAERLVTIQGSLAGVLRAVCLIVSKMAEQPSYESYRSMPLMAATGQPLNAIPRDNPFANAVHTISVGLSEADVGAILGKGGKGVAEVQRISGATIRIQPRGQHMEGTDLRNVTVTGRQEAVAHAQALMAAKLEASHASPHGGGPGAARRSHPPRRNDHQADGPPADAPPGPGVNAGDAAAAAAAAATAAAASAE